MYKRRVGGLPSTVFSFFSSYPDPSPRPSSTSTSTCPEANFYPLRSRLPVVAQRLPAIHTPSSLILLNLSHRCCFHLSHRSYLSTVVCPPPQTRCHLHKLFANLRLLPFLSRCPASRHTTILLRRQRLIIVFPCLHPRPDLVSTLPLFHP